MIIKVIIENLTLVKEFVMIYQNKDILTLFLLNKDNE